GGGSPNFVWKNNGTIISGANAASYSSNTLADNDVITVELTSSAPCSSPTIVGSNPIAIAVTPSVTPTISISASSTSVCAGSVTFTASAANGGSSPVYQWKINGSNVGTNANIFTSSTLSDGDVISCTLTSNANCATATVVNSNNITMSVTTPAAPVVVISESANNVCEGTSVIFTTNVTNAGTSPVYQWKVNGNNVGTSSATYTSNTLMNGDVVTCQYTSVNACSGSNTVNSNSITMSVETEVTPTVSINASTTTICSGTSVSFTATATNEGTTPVYQWKVNGVDVGTNSSTFISNTLADNDVVSCVLTSSVSCVSSANASSNSITMSVGSNATPTISITSSASSICTGENVTFNATTTNGGTTPVYQWKLNGANVGTNATSFASSSLANGDVVTCVLTSNANCVSSTTANSNAITIIVNTAVTPSVTMTASASSICSGDNVTFNATATNGGTIPMYQWKLNGNDVGTNSSSYANNALNDGDAVTVVMTSSITCTSVPTATASPVTITVNPSTTPTISITASQTSVCDGSPILFTASVTNEGANPVYEWYRNATLVGTNSATLNISTLTDADTITCQLTSDAACTTSANVTSNGITVTVNNSISASVSITGSASSICAGETVNFTATATNGGTSPVYQWKVNGVNAGTNSAMFSSNALANGDVVSCSMASNEACASPMNTNSNALTMIVNAAVTPSVMVSASATSICNGDNVTFNATATNGGTTPAYQWKLNGNDVGTNSSSYSNSALNDGDAVTVVMTSSLTCTSVPTATASPVTIMVNPSVTPTISISASATTICLGTSVSFTASATNEGNAPVYQWKVNGTNTGTNSSTLVSSTLADNDIVTCELTSNVTCGSATNVTSNGITVTVNSSVSTSVSITGSASSICAGETVNFTATATNGGTSPVYQWKVNGANVGTNSAMFASNTLTNGDVVSCELTSNADCVSPATVQSNNLTMSELPTTTPTVSIAISSTTICNGELATFTAIANNAGSTPTYQWTLNGNNVGTNNTTYSNSALNNGDVVSLVMTSSALCSSSPTATASPITMTVNSASTPDVSIVSNMNNICAGSPVQFTASSTVAGNTPTYQWQINGANTSTGTTFTSSSLANGDIVTCILNTSGACVSPNNATSNAITMNVSPVVVPTISISASSTAFCSGTSVNFTASATNAGTTPMYQWQVNGMNIATGTIFNSNSLNDGDVVSCTLTSNANCANPTVVSSSAITVNVSSPSTPSVSISTSTNNICSGDFAAFTAIPTNGGSTPTYQWQVNGTNVGTNNSTYSSSTLNNNDVVTVDMTSSAACSSVATVTSSAIVMTVNTAATPDVTISASSNNVCSGASVTFTASSMVSGSNLTYQWQVNGTNVSTGTTFTTSTLIDGDDVSCILTTSGNCLSSSTANSNVITMTVGQTVTPIVSIVSSDTSTCAGTAISFLASSINEGTSPTYLWKVNGVSTGLGTATFVSSTLNNNDAVTCELTSSENCVSSSIVSSSAIVVSIAPLQTPSVTVSASETDICAGTEIEFIAIPTNGGTSPVYQWNVNGMNVGTNSNIFNTVSLENGDVVNVELTANGTCTNPNMVSGNPITILVSDTTSPIVSVTASPSGNICSGTLVNFVANPINGGSAPAYQWKVNGSVVGTNSNIFSSNQLNDNDVITCTMTANLDCSNNNVASSNTITMQVLQSPTQPVITTNSPICDGEKLVLASGMIAGATYEWIGPNATTYSTNEITIPNANTSHSGEYILTVSINACSSSSNPTSVAVNPKPIKPTITANGNVLTSSNATNYQWMLDNTFISGEISNSVSANQTGYYQVRASNSFGCYAASDSTYIVISSIDNLGDLVGVNIYPNPVETYTNISIDKSILSISDWTYSITDINGRLLEFDRKLDYDNKLNWADWADGIYFINVSDGINYKTFKLLKVKK
ncbi:MAG: T9SS type A sorting domain-containing protein, partial [Chitinophagales bacterium]